MFTNEEPMSLTSLGEGAAVEMFDTELQNCLDNIMDPNTPATQIREINLKVKIKPDEDRQIGEISIKCLTKFAPVREFLTKCMLGKTGRRGEARELRSTQQQLFDRDEKKVIPIEKGKEE